MTEVIGIDHIYIVGPAKFVTLQLSVGRAPDHCAAGPLAGTSVAAPPIATG